MKTVRQLAIADTGFDRSHLVAFTMTLSRKMPTCSAGCEPIGQ